MTSDHKAIRELIRAWHRATAAGDVDAILGFMSRDVVFLRAGQPPMKGRAAFERSLRELLVSHKVSSKSRVREIAISGDLAYAWTDLEVTVTPLKRGKESVRLGSTLSIFRRQTNGGWQMIRDANLLAE